MFSSVPSVRSVAQMLFRQKEPRPLPNKLTNETATMRRSPQQARGQQRVGLILDTAEQLFAERGYDAASTNEIAAQAGIPIGSVYQFFPNKEAILHALLARYREELAALYAEHPAPAGEPLADALARVLDVLTSYGGAHIGFSRMVLQAPAGSALATACSDLANDIMARIDAVLAAHAPALPVEQRRLYTGVGFTAVGAILSQALTAKQAGDIDAGHALIEQATTLLVGYLGAALGRAR